MEDDELTKISKKSPEEYAPGTFPVARKVRDSLGADVIKLAKYVLKIREEHKETKAKVEGREAEKLREILGIEIKGKKGPFSEFRRSIYTNLFTVYGITTLALVVGAVATIIHFANKPTTKNITNLEKDVKSISSFILKESSRENAAKYRAGALTLREVIEDGVKDTYDKAYKAKIDSYDARISDLANKIEVYQNENSGLLKTNEAYKKSNEELRESNEKSLKKIDDLEKDRDNLEKKLKEDEKKP